MSKENDIFEVAKQAYRICVDRLKEIGAAITTVNPDYSVRLALNRFDVLLQYSMLQVSLSDNYLDLSECMFIKDLTDYSDLCVFLGECGYGEVTWANIYNTNVTALKKILEDTEYYMIRCARDFINAFTLAGMALSDVLIDLQAHIAIIILATAKADGKVEKSEVLCNSLIGSSINVIVENAKKYNKK